MIIVLCRLSNIILASYLNRTITLLCAIFLGSLWRHHSQPTPIGSKMSTTNLSNLIRLRTGKTRCRTHQRTKRKNYLLCWCLVQSDHIIYGETRKHCLYDARVSLLFSIQYLFICCIIYRVAAFSFSLRYARQHGLSMNELIERVRGWDSQCQMCFSFGWILHCVRRTIHFHVQHPTFSTFIVKWFDALENTLSKRS